MNISKVFWDFLFKSVWMLWFLISIIFRTQGPSWRYFATNFELVWKQCSKYPFRHSCALWRSSKNRIKLLDFTQWSYLVLVDSQYSSNWPLIKSKLYQYKVPTLNELFELVETLSFYQLFVRYRVSWVPLRCYVSNWGP